MDLNRNSTGIRDASKVIVLNDDSGVTGTNVFSKYVILLHGNTVDSIIMNITGCKKGLQ